MEDYYEYLDSNGVTTLYKLIKDDTVALIDSYSVTINGITTTLDTHINDSDIHTPISDIENMVDTKISGLVNSAPETLDTLKELSDALGNDPNFATTVANQIGNKASKDDVYTKQETDTLLEGKANSVHTHVVNDITDMPTIPTKLSQLENDMGFGSGSGGVITSISWTNITNKPNFATVATSGSYNDLSNKPTIPKVYNKTLTIQKNGTNVATFTSNSNTDVTANITVPTKTSDLTNDSGFITGISWDKVTNKPTLAKVATSGSYTDLSNTPTIPTKVSQLENDTGFVSALTDVVDTKSNQTINGVKTFTGSPFVSNYATTNGFFTKLNTIARNEVPSQIHHSAFRVFDKNSKTLGEYCVEKSTSGSSLLHMDVHTEDSEGNDIMESLYLNLSNDGSTVSFHPAKNNRTDLGMSNYKWAKIYSDDVVHTSGNETITGNKTFTNQIYLGAGGTSYGQISAKDNNSILRLFGGTSAGTGANLDLYGENLSSGGFSLRARTSDKIVVLDGKVDGTLKWNGKNVALDENLVHTSGDETINGNKIFSNTIHRYADLTTSGGVQVYAFTDTNANGCGHIYNNAYWAVDTIINSVGAYNNKSGKTTEIHIVSNDAGGGMAYIEGDARKGNLETVTSATGHTGIATMGWVNNPATSTNVVHRSGNETISGTKYFNNDLYTYGNMFIKNNAIDLTVTPSTTNFNQYLFRDKNNVTTAYLQFAQQSDGNVLGSYVKDKSGNLYGVRVTTLKQFLPFGDNTYSLGSSSMRWGNVYATTLNGKLKGNADTATSATKASYLDNYSAPNMNKIYLDWDVQERGYVGLKVDNTTMGGLITTANIGSQAANSATYATTQATSDNSTKIATTAWVRTYVNSVVGTNTVGSSVSAYWSNSSNVTATGQASSGGYYPECYSKYISKTPEVGTIYSGAQLYTVLNTSASATGSTTGSSSGYIYYTNTTAQATFSNPINASGKYLCTTANTVKFRAYTAKGSASAVGASSVIDNSSTKSIFIRVE